MSESTEAQAEAQARAKMREMLLKGETKLKRYGIKSPLALKEVQSKIKKTNLEKYGHEYSFNFEKIKKTNLEKYGVDNPWKSKQIRDTIKQTNLEKYGSYNPLGSKDIRKKIKQTMINKYGKEYSAQIPEIKKKQVDSWKKTSKVTRLKTEKTFLKKYGVKNVLQNKEIINKLKRTWENKTPKELRNLSIKRSKTRSKLESVNGIYCDSTWEQNFVKTHPGCKRGPVIKYIDENNKKRYWNIDFEWEGKLYEIKNPWMLKEDNMWPGHSKQKFLVSKDLGIRWYLWNPGNWNWPKLDLITEFRSKECHVGKMKNPWEGFNDPILRFKAEENLAKELGYGGNLLKRLLNGKPINEMIVDRFTIAKIAPKISRKSYREIISEIKNSGLNYSNGIICPCAGFGGVKQAAKELGLSFEGYDLNEFLCKYFKYEQRDLLNSNPIITDKLCWASPPHEDKETWGDSIPIETKEWWYNKVQENIISSAGYVFSNRSDKTRNNGLFGKHEIEVIVKKPS